MPTPARIPLLLLLTIAMITTTGVQAAADGPPTTTRIPDHQEHAAACLGHPDIHNGTACTIQHFHFSDPWSAQDVMNLEPAPPCSRTITTSTAPTLPGSEYHANQQERIGFFHTGGIQYDLETCTAESSQDPFPVVRDVRLSRQVPLTASFVLSSGPLEANDETSLGFMPCVTVRMVLETGEEPGQGEVVAEGSSTRSIVTATGLNDTPVTGTPEPCPEASGTIHAGETTRFIIDLGPAKRDLPGGEHHHLRIQWYQWSGEDPEEPDNLVQPHWRIHAGGDHPAWLVMPVEDPLEIVSMDTRLLAGKLYVTTKIHSPWGDSDVDSRTSRLQVFDADGKEVPLDHLDDPRINYDHDPRAPRSITYPWDHTREGLDPGRYLLRVTTSNSQATATASNETWVHLHENEPPQESPLPVLALIGAALMWLAWARIGRIRH